jgi:hypothetical protein
MSAVLWKFQFSTTTAFSIELTEHAMRFYIHGAPVLNIDLTPYEIWTPYLNADLHELHYKQINDVVYITHPSYDARKLSRLGDADWTLEKVVFMQPPTLDENITNITITPSAISGTVTLTASDAIFTAGHIGSYWRIGHLRPSSSTDVLIQVNHEGLDLRVLGEWNFRTYGVWNADLRVEKVGLDWASTGAPYEVVRKWSGRSDRNIDATGISEKDMLHRIVVSNYVSNTDGRAVLEAVDALIYAVVKITGVSSGTVATCQTLTDFWSTAGTTRWQEAAFSDYRGHPRTVEIHEERLCFGGTAFQPQTVYGSVIGDYENHNRGTEDDAAIVFTLGGTELNAIQWMVSQTDLLIGTTGGEWRVSSRSTEKPLTPSTITARLQSSYGSEYIQAAVVDGVILFVQRKGRKIREMVYTYDQEKFVSADLTLLAEHVTEGGVVQIALQSEPIPILWCVTGTGKLVALTYARDQQVTGWHRHPIDGVVESVTTLYGANTTDDEVWLVVKRTVNGSDVRYVERLNPAQWALKEDAYFVDCGVTYNGAPATVITGLGHLEGRAVDVLADGAVITGKTVTGGQITLAVAASKVHVGLNFISQVSPMRIDSDGGLGAFAGKVRRIAELILRVRKTLGIAYANEEKSYDVELAGTANQLAAATALQTKDQRVPFHGDLTYNSSIVVKQSLPLPFTLQAIIPKYEVTGK